VIHDTGALGRHKHDDDDDDRDDHRRGRG